MRYISLRGFQSKCRKWVEGTFGKAVAQDRRERALRFLEESIELMQATEMPEGRVHEIVDYVYRRPQGSVEDEVGGVFMTFLALASALDIDLQNAGNDVLDQVYRNQDAIRQKWLTKPHNWE